MQLAITKVCKKLIRIFCIKLCLFLYYSLLNARSYVYCDEHTIAQGGRVSSGSISGPSSGGPGNSGLPRMMPRPNLSTMGYPLQPQYPNISSAPGIGGPSLHHHGSIDTTMQLQHQHGGPYTAYSQFQSPADVYNYEKEQQAAAAAKAIKSNKAHHQHSHGHSHHGTHQSELDHQCSGYDFMSGPTPPCRSQPGFRKSDRMVHDQHHFSGGQSQSAFVQMQPSTSPYMGLQKKSIPSASNPSEPSGACSTMHRPSDYPSSTSAFSTSMSASIKQTGGSRAHQPHRASTPSVLTTGISTCDSGRGRSATQSSKHKDYGMLNMNMVEVH